MAKRKRPVALFEVINKDKRFERHVGALQPPAWWFKGRPSQVTGQTPSVAEPVPLPSTTQPIVKTTPDASAAGRYAGAAVRNVDRFAPLRAELTRLKRRLYARLTPASVAIIGGTLVVLGLAVLAARWQRPTGVEAILKGPPHPEVMDVTQPRATSGAANLIARQASAPLPPATAAGAVQAPGRQVNMGYVVIHMYESQRSALRAADYMTKNEIPCTVEHGIPGIAPQYYAVVGLTPFAKTGTAVYESYITRVKAGLAFLSGGAQTAKAFKPQWFKWPAMTQSGQAG